MEEDSDVFDVVKPTIYEADESDRSPCCAITEGGWTWFGSVLLTLTLFALFHLKYKKKVISRPKNLRKHKNEQVLKGYLLAQQKAARTDMPEGYLSVEEFEKCCEERKKYPIIFKIEFGTSTSGLAKDPGNQTIARSGVHQVKNRTGDILPNDDSRVVLKHRTSDEDYINASHVTGLVPGKDYIVTQGPMDNTVVDFWQMFWQQRCPGIVMLTKTFDYIRVMSSHYWPSYHREETYGDISVRLMEEQTYASYIKRSLRLVRHGETRDVTHFQFTEWPCYTSPYTGALLHFRRMVAETMSRSAMTGPPVIHCHDGGGRSGVYIMLDANIHLVNHSSQVNIFSYLRDLRKQRSGLVASQDHYKLIYSLVEEYLILGDTSQNVQEFLEDNSDDKLSDEFGKVNKTRPSLSQGDCAGGHRVENRSKNRSVLVLPPDKHRPYITSFQGNDCTDYINAVFVDGYSQLNEFIVTEWPLSNTVQNFWSMLYDHDVVTVLVLDAPRSSHKYPSFWPEFGKPKKYGPVFSVEQVKLEAELDVATKDNGAAEIENAELIEKKDAFISVRVNISKKEVAPHRKTQTLYVDEKQSKQMSALTNLVSRVGVSVPARRCQIFQLTGSDCSPRALANMMVAAKRWREAEKPDSPMAVVSCDGLSRAGVWCAASQCWDQVIRDSSIDLAHAVRSVRISRPQMVCSLQEYNLVRDVVTNLIS